MSGPVPFASSLTSFSVRFIRWRRRLRCCRFSFCCKYRPPLIVQVAAVIAVLLLTLPLLMLAASHLSAISSPPPEDRRGDSSQQSGRRSAGQPEGGGGDSPHRAGTGQVPPFCSSNATVTSSTCPRLSAVWRAAVAGPGPARTAVHRTAWGVGCIVSFTVYALSLGGVVRIVGEFVGVPSTLALIQV